MNSQNEQLLLRMPIETKRKLRRLAAVEGVSLNAMLNKLIAEAQEEVNGLAGTLVSRIELLDGGASEVVHVQDSLEDAPSGHEGQHLGVVSEGPGDHQDS